jgi:hypothetical protein
LLLPYWARLLVPIAGIVLPWRDPLSVAHSLVTRDGIPVGHGLDLWQRYNEAALHNTRGLDVFVASYDDMVEDPGTLAADAAHWLQRVLPGFEVDAARVAEAADAVSPELRHEHGDGEILPSPCGQLKELFTALRGDHPHFAPELDGSLFDAGGVQA